MQKRIVAVLIALAGGGLLAGLPVLILRGLPAYAGMTCNIIPRAVKLLRAEQGLVDRPVAGPGDTVTVTADLGCDTSLTRPGFSRTAANNGVTLEFHGPPPGTLANPPTLTATVLRVLDCEDPNVVADARCNTLQFDIPDTSPSATGLGVVLAGPARIRVMDGATQVGEIFELLQPSLGCEDRAPDPSFGRFTVLAPPNVLATPDAGSLPELVGAIDGRGNAVFRFHVGDALVAPPGDPVATIIEYRAPFFSLVPTQDFLATFNAFGQRIPPLQRLTVDPVTGEKKIIGTIDVPEGLTQIAETVGTESIGIDFADLVERDALDRPVGPVRLPTAGETPPGPLDYAVLSAAPLLALRSSVGTVAIGADEELLGEINQDGDAPLPIDLVAEITDLASGARTETGMALGEFAFSAPRPAIAVQGDLVAFLQSEASSGHTDLNLDGDALDEIFRAFQSGVSLTPGPPPAQSSASDEPVVDGRQLAISEGFVFFRTAEADEPLARKIWETGTASGTVQGDKVDGSFFFAPGVVDVPGVDYSDATTAADPGKLSGVKFQCTAGSSTATLSGNWLAPGQAPRLNVTVVNGPCTFEAGSCPQGTVTCAGAIHVPSANPPLPPELTSLRFAASFVIGPLAGSKRPFTSEFEFSALLGEDAAESLNGDADALDTVLQSFDTASGSLQPAARSAASLVATAGGRALVLTPEAEQGNLPLNLADLDTTDEVAQLYDAASGAFVNLGVAATDVALSPDVACVAASESGEQDDLDGDGDESGAVLFAGDVAALLAGEPLQNVGIPVTKLGALGSVCVALVPETGREVLVLWDHAAQTLTITGQAAEDFVLGPESSLVGFRTPEAQQGADLNGDEDLSDSVMQIWRIAVPERVNTQRQAIPCDVAGCEAFQLGTIVGNTMTFLGTEQGQAVGEGCLPQSPAGACDLDGDGDGVGTVVHTVTLGNPVSFGVIPFTGKLDPSSPVFALLLAGDLKICEELTECEAAVQGCSPLEQPSRFAGDPASVVPRPGCEERFDIDSNAILDCRAGKLFCDGDPDGDGVFNQIDACPTQGDPSQSDQDGDLLGDVCDPIDTSTLPCHLDCDLSGDGFVTQTDIDLLFGARGTRAQNFAACGDRRDRDENRLITIFDAALCQEECDFAECAEPPPPGDGCGLLGIEAVLALGVLGALRRRRAAH